MPASRPADAKWDTSTTMKDEEIETWLCDLREQAADTVDLLNNQRKQEREKKTCASFLRCAGVPFTFDQIQASDVEPPDVCFGAARLEITLSVSHQMHREWKERLKHRAGATKIEELMEPYRPPEGLSRQQTVDLAIAEATKKEPKYNARGSLCEMLDLLVYINGNVELNVGTPAPNVDVLAGQGWRSVSILIPPYSYVVLAKAGAPDFLLERVGEPRADWPNRHQIGLWEI